MNVKRILLYLVPGIILLVFSLSLLISPNTSYHGAEQKIEKQKKKIASLITSIEKGNFENLKLQQDLLPMAEIRKGAIAADKNGALILRERFDNACSKSGVTIRTVGDIQKREIEVDELIIYEVNFSAEATLKELLALMTDFEKQLPRIYWRSLTIRPNMNRDVDLLNISGTITLLAIGGDE